MTRQTLIKTESIFWRMHENTLILISLLCTLSGLSLLFYSLGHYEYHDLSKDLDKGGMNLQDLPKEMEGKDVKVKGKIVRVSSSQRSTKVTLEYRKNLTIWAPSRSNITKGDSAIIFGMVRDYKGKRTLSPKQIHVIKDN